MRYTTPGQKEQFFFIAVATILCFLLIFGRLLFFQIYHYNRFQSLGQKNFFRLCTTPSLRGNILDCNGNLLATNRPITNIDWKGTGNLSLTSHQKQTISTIESILQEDGKAIMIPRNKLKQVEKFATSMRIASDINFQSLSKISEQCADNKNITISTHFKRYYPHNSLACHTLGYLGDINMQSNGKMGLEKIFEDTLKGKNGLMKQIINSFGKQLDNQAIAQSESGQNITTTINLQLQKIAEKHMPHDKSGAFILLNPQNGAIRSLVSRPSFDPSIFLQPISSETWKELTSTNPFINRAFNACYPPASIFKLITIASALEHGIINPDTQFHCKGYVKFKGRRYYCNRRWGHGILNIKETLAHSCNIGCYEIAKQISIDVLADYAFRFGLGEKTNIIFPEKEGIVPSNDWKIITKGERWWKGETLSAAIGQSFLLTTPIQIACMIGALFKGYLVKPRVLEQSEIITKPLDVQEETQVYLQECMESVVTTGTGKNINRLKDITVFAKTGTAQTSSKQTKNSDYTCHAWFVSYFYYKDNEPLVLVVLIEKVGGSRAATTIAKKFLADYITHIEKESNHNVTLLLANNTSV